MAQQPPGWYADPTGRHTYRYWDGSRWSNQVSDGGTAAIDPNHLDEQTAGIPPAPGTQAPTTGPTSADEPPSPRVEVAQRSGGGGLIGVLGVLVGAIVVILILVMVFNNAADDGNTPSTQTPATSVADDPPATEAPATTTP